MLRAPRGDAFLLIFVTYMGSAIKQTRKWSIVGWCVGLAALVGLYGGTIMFARWEKRNATPPPQPAVIKTRPANGEAGVLPNAFVAADVFLPNFGHGIDARTMNTRTVKLFKVDGEKKVEVAGHVNTSGAGDAIVFQPTDMLDPGTRYQFECKGVRDTSDDPANRGEFKPYTSTFTTASSAALSSYPVAFDKVEMPHTAGNIFTGLTVGPDHRLYAGTFDGRILRYDFKPDGRLSEAVVIRTVIDGNIKGNGSIGNRMVIGLCFDPRSTAQDMVLWVTHGIMALEHVPDWGCKVSRLSGVNLDKYEDYVVGLPRAWRDHLTFKMAFGPDGALYFNQGSSSSTGAADTIWGLRGEHLLTAACLRLDTAAVAQRLGAGQGPLNAKTEGDRRYDPWATDAPLTLYATGIRSGFALLWHDNGRLYTCVNGGARGGAAPATPESLAEVPRRIDTARAGSYNGPRVPAIETVTETQPDLFLMIEQGAYYGHPNSTRGEYVLFGGNPDGGTAQYQVRNYPVGVQPDRNWRPALWNLGISYSCNGLIQYKGAAFGGALAGKILTTRYSGGKDILVIALDEQGRVAETVAGIDGFTQFIDPLDLVEDKDTGNLYVSEFGGQRLTLLKPKQGSAAQSGRVYRRTPLTAVSNVE